MKFYNSVSFILFPSLCGLQNQNWWRSGDLLTGTEMDKLGWALATPRGPKHCHSGTNPVAWPPAARPPPHLRNGACALPTVHITCPSLLPLKLPFTLACRLPLRTSHSSFGICSPQVFQRWTPALLLTSARYTLALSSTSVWSLWTPTCISAWRKSQMAVQRGCRW